MMRIVSAYIVLGSMVMSVYAQINQETFNVTALKECIAKETGAPAYSYDTEKFVYALHEYDVNDGTFDRIKKCYYEHGALPDYIVASIDYPRGDLHNITELISDSVFDIFIVPRSNATQGRQGEPMILQAADNSGNANMRMRAYRSKGCDKDTRYFMSCNDNFNVGECVTWAGAIAVSSGWDNWAGYEHDAMYWPHHECRSESTSTDGYGKTRGERITFYNGVRDNVK